MPFLDNFSVLLLDMNGTFMFGHDRFGPSEDYFSTYQSLGGRRLDREGLTTIMQASCDALLSIYETPERYDDFPTLAEAFRLYGQASAEDLTTLEQLFAAHEIGHVPPSHRDFLKHTATTHALGVVSNICSHPDLWLHAREASEVFGVFTALAFSSEGRSIKPSPTLFRRALASFPQDARVLFIGDSLERDIIPAKGLGLSTAWIAPPGSAHPAADRVVTSLPDLSLAT
jgi:HAD superfamily hydrolase (TIGR01549 family)